MASQIVAQLDAVVESADVTATLKQLQMVHAPLWVMVVAQAWVFIE